MNILEWGFRGHSTQSLEYKKVFCVCTEMLHLAPWFQHFLIPHKGEIKINVGTKSVIFHMLIIMSCIVTHL
jgi:hypothetical protein